MQQFLDFLKNEKGLRDRSIKDYRLGLGIYGENNLLLHETYKEVAATIVSIKKARQWSDVTTYKLCTVLGEFWKWCCREGLMKQSPFHNGHSFKKNTHHNIEYFDWDDPSFKKLFNNPNLTIRVKAVLHVLKSSGIRSSELCALKIADVQGRWLNIEEGKGGKKRVAPMDEECRYWLSHYIKCLKEHYQGEWLFPREDFSGPIQSDSLWKMLSRMGKKTGMHIYPHKFRHSLAGELISKGCDLAVCADVLGHKSLATTKIYTHLKKETILTKYDEALKHL